MRGPIARATLGTTGVLLVRLLAQAGTLLMVAHLLGAEAFGGFVGVAALAVTLGALSTFGTHLLLLREVSCAPNQPSALLPLAFGTTVLVGGIMLLIFILLALLVLQPSGMAWPVVLAIGLSDVLLLPLLQIPVVERQGQGQIVRSQWLMVLPQVLRLLAAAGVMLLSVDDPLGLYALLYFLAALLSWLLAAASLREKWPPLTTWRLPSRQEWREAGGFAALNFTALGPSELDKTLALHLLPAGMAGSYAAASRVLGPLVLPVLAMMIAALPRLFRHAADTANAPMLHNLTLGLALAYGTLAGAALWWVAPAVAWLFGAQYQDMIGILQGLAWAVPGMTLRYVTSNLLMTLGHPWRRIAVELVGLALMAVVAVATASTLGALGVVLAVIFAEWVMAGLGWLMIRRGFKAASAP